MCTAHHNLLHCTVLTILVDLYKLQSSSSSILNSLLTSSFLDPNILPSTLFSNTCVPPSKYVIYFNISAYCHLIVYCHII
jgi:hypothetical protein